MGIAEVPRLERRELTHDEIVKLLIREGKEGRPFEHSTGQTSFIEGHIMGLDRYMEVLNSDIPSEKKKTMSLLLWKILGEVAKKNFGGMPIADIAKSFKWQMEGTYSYF